MNIINGWKSIALDICQEYFSLRKGIKYVDRPFFVTQLDNKFGCALTPGAEHALKQHNLDFKFCLVQTQLLEISISYQTR